MTETVRKMTADGADAASDAAKGVLDRVMEDMTQMSGKARRKLDEAAHMASDVVGDIADEAVSRGKQVAKFAVREVREHPVTTLAIGAAVGVLISAFLMRKR